MSEKQEKKTSGKVKKKWVITSAGIWVGLLSAIVAAANPDLLPNSIRKMIGSKTSEELKADSNAQSRLHEFLGEQIIDQTGQSVKLNDSIVQKLNESAQIFFDNQNPDTDQKINLDQQQIKSIFKIITPENNHDVSPQQALFKAASVVVPNSETLANEIEIPTIIEKVVEHVEKVAPELTKQPLSEDEALKKDLEKTKKEFEEQMKQLKVIEEENQLLSEKIDTDKQALRDREERVSELTALVDERKALLEERNVEIAEAESELRDVEIKLNQTEEQTERVKLKAKISVLKEEMKQKETTRQQLAKKIEVNEKELQKHQKVAEKLKQKLEAQTTKVKDNEQKINELAQQLQLDPSVISLTPDEAFEKLSSLEQEISQLQSSLNAPFPPGFSEEAKVKSQEEIKANIAKLEAELSAFKHARPDALEQKVLESQKELGQKQAELAKASRKDQIATQLVTKLGDNIEKYLDKENYEQSPFNLQILNDSDLSFLKYEYNKLDIDVRKTLNSGQSLYVQKQFAIWELMTLKKDDSELSLSFNGINYDPRDIIKLLDDNAEELKNGNKHPMFILLEWLGKKRNQSLVDYSLGLENLQKHRFSGTDTPEERDMIKKRGTELGKIFGGKLGRFLYSRPPGMDAATWINILDQAIASKVSIQQIEDANTLDQNIAKIRKTTGIDILPFRPPGLTDQEFSQFVDSNLAIIQNNDQQAQNAEKIAISDSQRKIKDLNDKERELEVKIQDLEDYLQSDGAVIDQMISEIATKQTKIGALEAEKQKAKGVKKFQFNTQINNAKAELEELENNLKKFEPFKLLEVNGINLQEKLSKMQGELQELADNKETLKRSLEREKIIAHNSYVEAQKFLPKDVETVGKIIIQLKAAADKFGVYLGIYQGNRSNEDWLHQLEQWNALPDGFIPKEIQDAKDNEEAAKNYTPVPASEAILTDDPADQQPILNLLRQIKSYFKLPQQAVNTLRGTLTSSQWRAKLQQWINDYDATKVIPADLQKLIDDGYQIDNDLEININKKLNMFAPMVSLKPQDFEKYAADNAILNRHNFDTQIDAWINVFNTSMTLPPINGAAVSIAGLETIIYSKLSLNGAQAQPIQSLLHSILANSDGRFDQVKTQKLIKVLWLNIGDNFQKAVNNLGYTHPSSQNFDYVNAMIYAVANNIDPDTYSKAQWNMNGNPAYK